MKGEICSICQSGDTAENPVVFDGVLKCLACVGDEPFDWGEWNRVVEERDGEH